MSDLSIRRLSHGLGAEIVGIDIARPLSKQVATALRGSLLDNNILLVRDCNLGADEQIAFTKMFGELEPNEAVAHLRHDENPNIVLVTNEARNGKVMGKTGRLWHSDHSFILRPTLASVLYAKVLPDVGGDTMFANMYLAYDALSEGLKALLEPLWAVHDVSHGAVGLYGPQPPEVMAKKRRETPPVAQPVIRIHPETGRKALYVSEMLTTQFIGMSREESSPLLKFLFEHAVRPEFTYRHQWRNNDLMIWDNRCTMHLALADFDEKQTRTMFRTAVSGTPCGRALEAEELAVATAW
jgi:taurine dioxygenase